MKLPCQFRFVMLLLLVTTIHAQTDALQQGVVSFREGRYEEALTKFRAAQRLQPNDASLENFIGITETKLGHVDDANKAYQISIRLNPRSPEAHKNLAFNYLQVGQYGLAETQLKSALALDSSDPATHYYLVILYLSTQRDREVVANIDAAKELLKSDSDTAISAIEATLRSGATEQAEKLADFIEIGSGLSVKQEYQLAKDFDNKSLYVDSAKRYRRVLQMSPDSWEAQYDLAVTLAKAKQVAEALNLLQSMEDQHSDDPKISAMIASAAEYAGDSSLALNAYEKAITADPANPDRYLDCTRLLMDLNRYDDAAKVVTEGISQVPDPYALRIRLGAVEMMRGSHERARVDYQEAIAMHPEVALGYVALAQTYFKDGDEQKAMKVLIEGRTRVPPDFALEYAFGLVSSDLGQQEQAIEAFTRSGQLNPDIVEPHYKLGMIYFQNGELKKAQEEFESVLRINDSYAGAYYQLSRLYARLGDMERAHRMAEKGQELLRTQQDQAITAEKSRLSSFQPQ
jgi:tetratricopeptide (TPR) repeat protein